MHLDLYCREQLQDLYVRLHDLIAYNELNREGFRKALKKHDKVLARVAPKLLEEQRPRWETVLSDTSREKLQVSSPPSSRSSPEQLSPEDAERTETAGLSQCCQG